VTDYNSKVCHVNFNDEHYLNFVKCDAQPHAWLNGTY